MTIDNRSREELLAEIEQLRLSLEKYEQCCQATEFSTVDETKPNQELFFCRQNSENLYRTLVETMHEGALTLGAEGTILFCNRALAFMLGRPREQLIGTKLADYVASTDSIRFQSHLTNDLHERDNCEISLIVAGGSFIPVLFSCRSVGFSTEQIVIIVLTDISAIKRTEKTILRLNRLYAVTSAINHAIVHAKQPEIIFQEFCRVAVELGGFIIAWVGLVDKESGWVNVAAAEGQLGYLDGVRVSANLIPEGMGPTGIVIRQGGHYICNDFLNSEITRPWHGNARAHGIYASASIAIKLDQEVIGALTLYAGEKDYFDAQQEELLLQMGADISFALDNLAMESRIREAEEQKQINIKRERVAMAIRDSEERLRFALETINTGAWDLDLNDHTAYRSLEHDRIFGYNELLAEWSYETFLQHVLPEDRREVESSFQQAIANRSDWRFECRIRRSDGEIRYILAAGRHFINNEYVSPRMAGIVQDITERKLTELELIATQQRLMAIMQALPVGISFSDDTTCQNITGNPVVLAQFDINENDNLSASAADENVPGRQVRFFREGMEIQADELPLQRAVAENRIIDSIELEIVNPGGRRWFAEASGAPIVNRDNIVIGGVAVTVDISQRKLAEKSLRESEERLRLVLEASLMGSFEVNLNTGDGQWNEVEFALLGVKAGAIPSNVEEFFRYVHPDDIATVRAGWDRALETGELDVEFRIVRADGQERWLVAKGRYIFEDDEIGKAQRFLGVNYDITKRKRIEEKLRESEERYRNMMESAHDWIWEINADGIYTFSSHHVHEILGYTPEEIVGKRPFDLMDDDDADRIERQFGQISQQRLPIHNLINVNRHKDGRTVILETNGVPFYDLQGRFLGYRGMDRDITDQKKLEASLQQYNEMLECRVAERTDELRKKDRLLLHQSRLAAMGDMINNIAHQWRQPLNVLGLNLQRLPLYYEMGKFDQQLLDTSIEDAMDLIQHMSQTIDDFRDFFKPEKVKVRFSVKRAILQTVNLVSDSLTHHQIKLIVHIDHDSCINGYPNEFSQVALNILQNARDALKERKIRDALITISCFIEDGKTVTTITDNAGGIPEDIIDKIFEPYFSTKGVQGTGIGLYMSKNIIESNMGGKLSVRNLDGGAEFRIEV